MLNPFHPFEVWNPLHPFDAVDLRFGANLLDLAHLDDFDVLVVGFQYDFSMMCAELVAAQPADVHLFYSPQCQRVFWRELLMKIMMRCLSPSDKRTSRI